MPIQQTQRHCKTCGRKTLHACETFSFFGGCLLTILTAGLFIPIWALLMIGDTMKPWICQQCGKSRHF